MLKQFKEIEEKITEITQRNKEESRSDIIDEKLKLNVVERYQEINKFDK